MSGGQVNSHKNKFTLNQYTKIFKLFFPQDGSGKQGEDHQSEGLNIISSIWRRGAAKADT